MSSWDFADTISPTGDWNLLMRITDDIKRPTWSVTAIVSKCQDFVMSNIRGHTITTVPVTPLKKQSVIWRSIRVM